MATTPQSKVANIKTPAKASVGAANKGRKPKNGFKPGKSGNPAGRPKGSKNYYNKLTNEERQMLASDPNGLNSIEFMMSLVRSEGDIPLNVRLDAAAKVAPYIHRRMPIAIEGGDPSKPINIMDASLLKNLSDPEIKQLLALLKKAGTPIEGNK